VLEVTIQIIVFRLLICFTGRKYVALQEEKRVCGVGKPAPGFPLMRALLEKKIIQQKHLKSTTG